MNGGSKRMQRAEVDHEDSARQMRTFLLRAEEDKRRLAQRIEKLIVNGIKSILRPSFFKFLHLHNLKY